MTTDTTDDRRLMVRRVGLWRAELVKLCSACYRINWYARDEAEPSTVRRFHAVTDMAAREWFDEYVDRSRCGLER